MSSDPFDLLRKDLEKAAARTANRRQRPRRSSWKHPAALIAAGLALTGSATAAILTVTADRSAPLAGAIPGDHGPSAGRYAIKLTPDLAAGHTGWCFDLAYGQGTAQVGRATGCFAAPPANAPLISATLATLGGRGVIAIITSPEVATVRLSSGTTVTTRAYNQLPSTMRAAVLVRRTGSRRFDEQRFTLMDARERVLGSGPPAQQPPGAPALATHTVSASTRPRYAITNQPAAGLLVRHREVVLPAAVSPGGSVRGAFLTASAATYDFHGQRMHAAYLLNAAAPRTPAMRLPGQHSTTAAGVYTAGDLTARRSGAGWLVVTGATANLRQRLLTLLSIVG